MNGLYSLSMILLIGYQILFGSTFTYAADSQKNVGFVCNESEDLDVNKKYLSLLVDQIKTETSQISTAKVHSLKPSADDLKIEITHLANAMQRATCYFQISEDESIFEYLSDFRERKTFKEAFERLTSSEKELFKNGLSLSLTTDL